MANILSLAGLNSRYQQPGAKPAGFLIGLWHGIICPITFLVSLGNPGVRMYEANNRGPAYDFGFMMGASSSLAGGSSGAHLR